MRKTFKMIVSSLLIMFILSSTVSATIVSTAAGDLAKDALSKIDVEAVKDATTKAANDGVEKGKELIDKLDSEYGDDIEEIGAQSKSLWDKFVEWLVEAFKYIMHLFMVDSKTNLIGTLNDGIEKEKSDKTSNVLDDITNEINTRNKNANLGNLNISAIDKLTSKLPEVEKTKKSEEKVVVKEEKKSIEEIVSDATKKVQEAKPEEIEEGTKNITDTISKVEENFQIVGDTIEDLGLPVIGDLIK